MKISSRLVWLKLTMIALFGGAIWAASLHAQPVEADPATIPTASGENPTQSEEQAGAPPPSPVTADEFYGMWVLLPPLVAIGLAILTRQVIPSLVIAVVVGGYMMQFAPTVSFGGRFGEVPAVVRGLRMAVEGYLMGAIQDTGHVQIMVFTLLIGGMVGILASNGGTSSLVQAVSRRASTSRRGQLLSWLAGLVVFFDDYANAMIVGPTMAPICDKLRISRQKLAYIVDSTAAPVASLALIGTWIGAEIGFIQKGLTSLGESVPEFMVGLSPYEIFLYSIPYRFYAIFALLLVLLIAITGRDFGPMKTAERRASVGDTSQAAALKQAVPPTGKWWFAGYPILLLVAATLAILFVTGWQARDVELFAHMPMGEKLGELLKGANANVSILYGAGSSLVLAVIFSVAARSLTLSKTVEAALEGMSRMFPAIVVLILAWTLSDVLDEKNLRLAAVAEGILGQGGLQLSPSYLPVLIFVSAAVVSFATGTSWGTMGILCPVAVTLAAGLAGELPDVDAQRGLFYASVGSVLAGAVFGDHCSPISDTTVLSALASGCSLESHVWTQLPYALVAAVVAVLGGDLLCSHFNQPSWVGLLAGATALLIIVLVIGRKPPVSTRG